MYLMGFTPWDRAEPGELINVIDGPEALPVGRALDLTQMASRRWPARAGSS